MGKLMSERTGGKNSIKVFGQSTLGSEKDTIEQTKIGALDMVRVNVAPLNNIVPATIVPSLPFLFKSTAHMRKVLDGPIGDEILAAMEAAGLHRPVLLRFGLALLLYRQEGDQERRRHQGHEDPRAAVRHVGGDDAGDRRQCDAAALCRGLHRAQDRRGRRGREQLAVLRILAPLRGGQDLQPDRAFAGAGGPGLLQEGLGRAAARKTRRSSARPPRSRCPTCASCGTSARPRRARPSKPRARRSSPTSTRSRSPTPWRRSTPSSRPTRSCRTW